MCLLNGDVSGKFSANTTLGTEKIKDAETGVVTYNYIPIKNIIRNILTEFGGEFH
jgi:hypothetical protein